MARVVVGILVGWLLSAGENHLWAQPRGLSAGEIHRAINETIALEKIVENSMTLKELLGFFCEKTSAKGKEVPILLDLDAFKRLNPDQPDVYDSKIQFPPFPKQLPLRTALRVALDQIPFGNPTFLIRHGHIVVTTGREAAPQNLLRLKVHGDFAKVPLADALEDLSGHTGASIILDNRLIEQAKKPLSATFRNDASLESVLTILTDMVDLKWISLPGGIYVTTPERAKALLEQQDAAKLQKQVKELKRQFQEKSKKVQSRIAAAPELMVLLKNGSSAQRRAVIRLLAQLGPEAAQFTDELLVCLEEELLRADAREALAEIGKDATPGICRAIKQSANPKIRFVCISLLGEIGCRSAEVLQALQSTAESDPAADNRLAAQKSLNCLK